MKKAIQVSHVLNLKGWAKNRFFGMVRAKQKNFAIETNFKVKKAPTFPWETAKKWAKYLWSKNENSFLKSKRRKMTCLMIYLTWFGGLRWVDAIRLKWDDVEIIRRQKIFVLIKCRITKANVDAHAEHFCTLATNLERPDDCPVRTLLEYWSFSGRPRAGYFFRTSSEGADLDSTYDSLVSAAQKFDKSHKPGKHSGRISCVNTLVALGAKPDAIKKHMNWGPNSEMISHYVSSHLVTLPEAPASILQNNKLSDLQSLFVNK